MALESIGVSPNVGDFTLLSEHQEQTPGTFFGGKPVLHLHCPGAKVKISSHELESQPALLSLNDGEFDPNGDNQVEINNIDVWITSKYVNCHPAFLTNILMF